MSKVEWDYSLYLVTDRSYIGGRPLVECVEEAIAGGVSLVQIREKTASSREFYELALQIKEVTHKYKVPLIINDRLDIALAIDADGLHLGQDDLPLDVARHLFGPHKVIGISAGTVEEAVMAERQGADYLGVGAMYATGTKTDANLVTWEELKAIKEAVKIPVVAIGGIKHDNAARMMQAGIDGVSVVSALLAAPGIREASRMMRALIKREK